jgi:serine/threonine protein kinase
MKEISKVSAYLDNSIDSVISEYKILRKIRYPLITNLYYSFQDKENIYLILDYLSGGNLRYYISKDNSFKESQIKFIISNVILSIEYIHNHGIIHRDLKPENLLFDSEGYVHISDFGISREMKNGEIIIDKTGTPGYISPEVIINKPQNEASDFFSIGVITYELIFGKRPFVGNNKKEIADNMINSKINLNANNLPPNFSIDIADFINGLLKRKNNQRLGYRGIDEIKNHTWLDDVDWIGIECKNLDINQIPLIPTSIENNFNISDNNDGNDNKKTDKYYLILEKINRENNFCNFYYNYKETKKGKKKHFDMNINEDDDFNYRNNNRAKSWM